jgi:hypothetical protein
MSYIILKYDVETCMWNVHSEEDPETGNLKTVLLKSEEEAVKVAESLNKEYEIYKFIRDSL